jgi:soluble lytic murein transglycosylase-like protein
LNKRNVPGRNAAINGTPSTNGQQTMKRLVWSVVIFAFCVVATPVGAQQGASPYRAYFQAAGERYGVSPDILWAIAKVESQFNPTAINYNSNGTFDYGIMQINSWWYRRLGHQLWVSLSDPATNINVGAWILAQCIQRHGNTWEAVGCYNANSQHKRTAYAWKVYHALTGKNTNSASRGKSSVRLWKYASAEDVGAIEHAQIKH